MCGNNTMVVHTRAHTHTRKVSTMMGLGQREICAHRAITTMNSLVFCGRAKICFCLCFSHKTAVETGVCVVVVVSIRNDCNDRSAGILVDCPDSSFFFRGAPPFHQAPDQNNCSLALQNEGRLLGISHRLSLYLPNERESNLEHTKLMRLDCWGGMDGTSRSSVLSKRLQRRRNRSVNTSAEQQHLKHSTARQTGRMMWLGDRR